MTVKRSKFRSFLEKLFRPNRNLASLTFLVVVTLWSFVISRFSSKNSSSASVEFYEHSKRPKYWQVCDADWNPNGHLRTTNRVFDRLGFEFVNASNGDDWDVMWSFEYPFDDDLELYDPIFDQENIKHHQRINHIPGIAIIANKLALTTGNRDLNFILPTFDGESKEEFESYLEKNPDKKFVEKNIWNRGVKLIDKEKINFEFDETIYQVFMDKPMLVDGRAFDMGIYVLISSINPLRVYRYDAEMLLRFCPDPYYPFNASNVDQYVIYETHKHYSELPSFKQYDDRFNYSLKFIYEDYLKERDFDPKQLWDQVDKIIETVVARNEGAFIQETLEMYSSSHHFFELVRFDFIVDEDFNLYLMEVNMSPNITPTTAKFERNAIVREKMVYDAVSLVGAGSYFDLMARYNTTLMQMISNPKDIAVNLESCIKSNCLENCHKPECRLCMNCLQESQDLVEDFHEASRENSRRGGFKRVFPSGKFSEEEFMESLSPRTKASVEWFEAKCQQNSGWC